MFYFQFDFDCFRNLKNITSFYIIHFTLSINILSEVRNLHQTRQWYVASTKVFWERTLWLWWKRPKCVTQSGSCQHHPLNFMCHGFRVEKPWSATINFFFSQLGRWKRNSICAYIHPHTRIHLEKRKFWQ